MLLGSAFVTMSSIAVWLYVRYHHKMVTTGLSTIDCGTWSNRSFSDSECLTVFKGLDLAYLVSTLGVTIGAVYFAPAFVATLRRPRIVARGGGVVLRAVGPRDAKAFAATIDADVIVENRMPFDVARAARRLGRWFGVPQYLAICEIDSGCVVGAVSSTVDRATMEVNLGIWVGAAHRGNGYATQALAAYVPSLHQRGFVRVIAETSIDNRAMRAALAHAGFEPAGNFTYTFPSGERIAAVRFISRATYEAVESAMSAPAPGDSGGGLLDGEIA
jgi:RimJ/RimL family protein N-acetyltransferase